MRVTFYHNKATEYHLGLFCRVVHHWPYELWMGLRWEAVGAIAVRLDGTTEEGQAVLVPRFTTLAGLADGQSQSSCSVESGEPLSWRKAMPLNHGLWRCTCCIFNPTTAPLPTSLDLRVVCRMRGRWQSALFRWVMRGLSLQPVNIKILPNACKACLFDLPGPSC